MATVTVVYHSGFGHTEVQAHSVARGAQEVDGVEVHLLKVAGLDVEDPRLSQADALVFGAPTYMGSLSAGFKQFMEESSKVWFRQGWKDKLAAGFTNSGSQSGDKLNSLVQLVVFAAQHGMHWVSLGLMPGYNTRDGSPDELNRIGAFLGAMAQSDIDAGPEEAPPVCDQDTAAALGRRVAEAALRWRAGG